MWIGWPHTHVWWLSIRRDISAVEDPLRSKGPQPHTGLPSPGFQWQEEESPHHLAVKISRIPSVGVR